MIAVYMIAALALIAVYFWIKGWFDQWSTTESPTKTWQEYEAEKPQKKGGFRKVYFTVGSGKDERMCESSWSAGKCYPSKQYKNQTTPSLQR